MNQLLSLFLILTLVHTAFAATYYVSLQGNDDNPGTKTKPFRTIQKAADIVKPGDACLIHGGAYCETIDLKKSGLPDKPIRFVAEKDHAVQLDGTEPVTGKWIRYKDNIYKIKGQCSRLSNFLWAGV